MEVAVPTQLRDDVNSLPIHDRLMMVDDKCHRDVFISNQTLATQCVQPSFESVSCGIVIKFHSSTVNVSMFTVVVGTLGFPDILRAVSFKIMVACTAIVNRKLIDPRYVLKWVIM